MNTEAENTVITDERLNEVWDGLSRKICGIEMQLHWKEAAALHILATSIQCPGMILEIGAWMGGSTTVLGNACKDKGVALVTVDHWIDRVVNPVYGYDSDIFDCWYGSVRKAGLEGTVVPIRGESFEVVKCWWHPIALLFIDGGHFEGIPQKDLAAWSPFVTPGGLLAIHDDWKPDVTAICNTLESQPETWAFVGKVETMRIYQRIHQDNDMVLIPNAYANTRRFGQ